MEAQVRQRALFRERPAGADASPASGAAGDGVSIGGLVINDTRTTIGRDFYDVFYGRWETPEGAENVMIRVYEQPRPNVGTRLLVDVEDQTVFRANLRPRFQQIKKAARRALARAVRYVQQHYEPREKY
jgi:curli production assembly/transport component CsgE